MGTEIQQLAYAFAAHGRIAPWGRRARKYQSYKYFRSIRAVLVSLARPLLLAPARHTGAKGDAI